MVYVCIFSSILLISVFLMNDRVFLLHRRRALRQAQDRPATAKLKITIFPFNNTRLSSRPARDGHRVFLRDFDRAFLEILGCWP
jgi:hypothetical protein